jgi:hypothetical protein
MELRRDRMLTQLDIEYLAEAFYGEEVTSEVEMRAGVSLHQLKNQAGTVLSVALARHE